jgi:NAD(P)-dependent dehydrogenase (short-subunit alcohol dehydrogenase family)
MSGKPGKSGPPAEESRLSGRTAFVCGADGAVGRGIAQRLAQQGANIVASGEDFQFLQQTVRLIDDAGGRVLMLAGAAKSRTQAEQMIAQAIGKFGTVGILVAAADYRTNWAPLTEKTEEMFGTAMRAFHETLWMMQAVCPVMRQGGGGSIIALGSTYGHFAQRFIADYKAAKEAVRGLMLSAAHEWGPYNIRVNLLNVAIDTIEFQTYRSAHGAAVEETLACQPMRRMGDPVQDAGGAALFLASDDSRYLTGECLYADGGEHLSAPVFDPRVLQEAI